MKENMQPEEALRLARAYQAEGKFREALEMHEWFHFNALKIRPSYYGVRLSFALADWARLGEKYPKAKQRLKKVRADEIKKVKGNDWGFESFHDVVSISRYLDDSDTAVKLFKVIEKKESDKKKLQKCFNVIFEHLIASGEIKLSSKYLIDPVAKVTEFKHQFEEIEKLTKKHKLPNGKSPAKNIYIKEMSLLVKTLRFAKRTRELDETYRVGQGIISNVEYDAIFEA